MKVYVDDNLCEGNARCIKLAPQVFALPDDSDTAVVIGDPDAHREAVEEAIARCPRQALKLLDS